MRNDLNELVFSTMALGDRVENIGDLYSAALEETRNTLGSQEGLLFRRRSHNCPWKLVASNSDVNGILLKDDSHISCGFRLLRPMPSEPVVNRRGRAVQLVLPLKRFEPPDFTLSLVWRTDPPLHLLDERDLLTGFGQKLGFYFGWKESLLRPSTRSGIRSWWIGSSK
ncbi:MAG: hypothetical protein LLF99_06790 [Desulfobacteraceae bacterium]|nr:hypothetical protein [Desulfobacteraceae bacterium]